MLTVHIAGKPAGMVQRCFRCNRVMIDYRRAASSDGKLGWWAAGAFVGVTHNEYPVQSIVMERDASGPDETACECPAADLDVAPAQVYQ